MDTKSVIPTIEAAMWLTDHLNNRLEQGHNSGDSNTRLVWYSNGPNLSLSCPLFKHWRDYPFKSILTKWSVIQVMAWILNENNFIQVMGCNTNGLNTELSLFINQMIQLFDSIVFTLWSMIGTCRASWSGSTCVIRGSGFHSANRSSSSSLVSLTSVLFLRALTRRTKSHNTHRNRKASRIKWYVGT